MPASELSAYERLIAELSARFVNLPTEQVDALFIEGLRRIVEVMGVERASLSQFLPEGAHFRTRHSWAVPGVAPVPDSTSSRTYPWVLATARAGKPIVFARLDDLPEEAHLDREGYRAIGLRSHIGQPIVVAGKLFGVLGLGTVRREHSWSSAELERSKLLADIFGYALARVRVQSELDRSSGFERLATNILAALLIGASSASDELIGNGLRDVGMFLGVDRVALWTWDAEMGHFHRTHRWRTDLGIETPERLRQQDLPWITARMLEGSVVSFSRSTELPAEALSDRAAMDELEVRSALLVPFSAAGVIGAMSIASFDDDREWSKRIVNGARLLAEVFAVVHARAASERREREAERRAEEDRAALQHMTRVSMLGQLSASIAHQLNQPLAAILGNAEAARKMLDREAIDVAELRNICDDIISADDRAAEVIRRLGALYKRGELELRPLVLNDLVRETVDLLRTELVTRQVTAVLELAPSLPEVDGGRVQLQQVLLNLILNAADAMAAIDPAQRLITIRTESAGPSLCVRVVDRGVGIAPANVARVFDAFWSTKPGGMGIGLAICRSIVDAHRGSLTVANNPEGGATFCMLLPGRMAA